MGRDTAHLAELPYSAAAVYFPGYSKAQLSLLALQTQRAVDETANPLLAAPLPPEPALTETCKL